MTISPGVRALLEYDDLAALPEGPQYELLDGRLFVTPSPSPIHQRVSKRLQRQLEAYFEARGVGEVFNAPLDVILSRHDVVIPDIIIVDRPDRISDRAIEGAPLLTVEIISPSTVRRDWKLKPPRYAAVEVPHYWIVDPAARTIECYRLADGVYDRVVRGGADEQLAHPDWPELVIDCPALWAGT